jgi:hypothetical protein
MVGASAVAAAAPPRVIPERFRKVRRSIALPEASLFGADTGSVAVLISFIFIPPLFRDHLEKRVSGRKLPA